MNKVILIGRLTKDPDVRATQDGKMFARYTLAVDRVSEGADFVPCVAFGKSAEFAQKYLHKGMKMAIVGRIQTGSYKDKDGKTVYTTDVVAGHVEFLDSKPQPVDMGATKAQAEALFGEDVGFSYTSDGMPF